MEYQAVFERFEIKYLLSRRQRDRLLAAMTPYMEPDPYGHTVIRSLYYDTDHYRLIRRSLEHPVYKEKLRVRSYGKAKPDSPVFVELKKKHRETVYKRRVELPEQNALEWLRKGPSHPARTQITDEVDYFLRFYETLHPVVFLSSERDAYQSRAGETFRLTLDEKILGHREELSLQSEVWGTPLLEENQVLLELKTSGALPLWMVRFLSEERLRKCTFSKYGMAYQKLILKTETGGVDNGTAFQRNV